MNAIPKAASPMPEKEKNIFLVVEYDGTDYCGWQRQKSDPTIQGTIENALAVMTRQAITLNGSGRTDSGVHAWGQTANFKCRTRLKPNDLLKGLNSLLPDTIVVRECRKVPLKFHARFDTTGKTYLYQIHNGPLPLAVGRQYVWHIRSPLDVQAMQQATGRIIGTHDFKTFEGSGSPRPHTRRCVSRARFRSGPQGSLTFEIAADGFLRYMVRNIVGTLVDVGLGKLSTDRFGEILAARDRLQAGMTAPPRGLFLKRVDYNPASFLEEG